MITEIAELTIDPAKSADFEAAVALTAPAFKSAKGCHGMALERVVEDPTKYRLVVQWDSVDHHLVLFRNSDNFQTWRKFAGPFFTAPPTVTHNGLIARYF
jgi:quinol monooxygenase YgiN